ncbi:MAG: hypothetical protein KJN96_00275 [Eudoraea sp.]|nr:hypothetical protein [Eudoraea sp.]
MISSVFGKTKPINYIILLSFLFIFYWIVNLYIYEQAFTSLEWVLQSVVLGFLLFSIFAVNFIVKRNQITANNSYAILFFTLLIFLFPEVLRDNNGIICGFFLLLAFRRIISIRSLRNVKMKLFDASLWIAVASIFYDWALLFFILVYITLSMYEPKNIRNWFVPIIATATVALIVFSVLIFMDNTKFIFEHYTFELGIYSDPGELWDQGRKLVLYAIFMIIIGTYAFVKIGKLGLGRILIMRLVAIAFTLGVAVSLIKTTPDTFPVIITFFPGAALLAKYVETIKRDKIREMVLIIGLLVPIITWIAEHIVK